MILNFIGRNIRGIGLIVLLAFVSVALGLYVDLPSRLRQSPSVQSAPAAFSCPMHPEVASASPDRCPKCGMALTPLGHAHENCKHCARDHLKCCAEKPAALIKLPPGHPPIPGMTVESDPPAEAPEPVQ